MMLGWTEFYHVCSTVYAPQMWGISGNRRGVCPNVGQIANLSYTLPPNRRARHSACSAKSEYQWNRVPLMFRKIGTRCLPCPTLDELKIIAKFTNATIGQNKLLALTVDKS